MSTTAAVAAATESTMGSSAAKSSVTKATAPKASVPETSPESPMAEPAKASSPSMSPSSPTPAGAPTTDDNGRPIIRAVIIRITGIIGVTAFIINRWWWSGRRHDCIPSTGNCAVRPRCSLRLPGIGALLLLHLLHSHGLLISLRSLIVQLTVAMNERANHVLRNSNMLQINDAIRREVKWQSRILDIAQNNVFADAPLEHFYNFVDSVRKRRSRGGDGRHGVNRRSAITSRGCAGQRQASQSETERGNTA